MFVKLTSPNQLLLVEEGSVGEKTMVLPTGVVSWRSKTNGILFQCRLYPQRNQTEFTNVVGELKTSFWRFQPKVYLTFDQDNVIKARINGVTHVIGPEDSVYVNC